MWAPRRDGNAARLKAGRFEVRSGKVERRGRTEAPNESNGLEEEDVAVGIGIRMGRGRSESDWISGWWWWRGCSYQRRGLGCGGSRADGWVAWS